MHVLCVLSLPRLHATPPDPMRQRCKGTVTIAVKEGWRGNLQSWLRVATHFAALESRDVTRHAEESMGDRAIWNRKVEGDDASLHRGNESVGGDYASLHTREKEKGGDRQSGARMAYHHLSQLALPPLQLLMRVRVKHQRRLEPFL